MDQKNGVWLLPTKARLANLKRFLIAAGEMGMSTPLWVVVNRKEYEEKKDQYEALKPYFRPNWQYVPVEADSYGRAVRATWSKTRSFDWVGLVSDDLVPSTSGWDAALVSRVTGWNFVSSLDGWQCQDPDINKSRMHGATVFSGELLREIGWLFPDRFRHLYHDDVFETIGRETGAWQIHPQVMVKHLHEALSGIRGDTMDPNSVLFKHDKARFEEWVQYEKEQVCNRVRGLMERLGVRRMTPEFSGVRLMIATPSISGEYEGAYVVALFQTMQAFAKQSVVCEWAEERYTADVALARSKLFSAFLRSQCTHLLMIDADMGWAHEAVLRLFCAKSDFAAIAGPKKRYPLTFAANYTTADGTPLNLQFDSETGTMEVSEIGSAFCLITRECAEKLIKAYPELMFRGATGEAEWGVFMPLVAHQRWFSEDFAFCYRLRTIGAKIRMVPDCRLSHTGKHVFEGAFSDTIPKPSQQEAAD